ncbi:phosphotransferase family protein [Microbacterium marinilacus]|uniref:Aminoglycoside phosphotransferase domain-containing protein n=1 Tax=Microbacterium marinilacus TaxID=415209 RepID=A0ABP7BB34_9MICO|nr:phosphotransferase [Microbacterium marinilacus]MBY0687148.1 aminoglycoside phosphotransferase family protein [Microbacterium marinilacus]
MTAAVPSALAALTAPHDPALPELGALLDPVRRADLMGAPTEVVRVRWKPGSSVVIALRDSSGGFAGWPHGLGWVVSYADAVKLPKTRRRAAAVGAPTIRLGETTVAGPAHGDRLLAPRVRTLLDERPDLMGGSTALRYNPHRRLLLRAGGDVVRLSAHGSRGDEVAARLAELDLPVLAPRALAPSVSSTPWWGDGDLAVCPDPVAARHAGAALALLHSSDPAVAPGRRIDAGEIARAAAAAVSRLLPPLAARARRAAERLATAPATPAVLVHGDFSPDQVLTDGRRVRLIDFDRAAAGPAEADLGSFLATGGSPALVDGYRDGGGRVDEAALRAWRALAELQRAVEPFRAGASDWPDRVASALARCEEGIA